MEKKDKKSKQKYVFVLDIRDFVNFDHVSVHRTEMAAHKKAAHTIRENFGKQIQGVEILGKAFENEWWVSFVGEYNRAFGNEKTLPQIRVIPLPLE